MDPKKVITQFEAINSSLELTLDKLFGGKAGFVLFLYEDTTTLNAGFSSYPPELVTQVLEHALSMIKKARPSEDAILVEPPSGVAH